VQYLTPSFALTFSHFCKPAKSVCELLRVCLSACDKSVPTECILV